MIMTSFNDQFTAAMLAALEETFEKVRGMYLDRGTSVFETLATLTAEEASRPVGDGCATIAAHVAHMRYYIDLLLQFVRGERPAADWQHIWRTVRAVTPEEWEASVQRLREGYDLLRELATQTDWSQGGEGSESPIGGAMALLMHNAYHLGEIRHALCTIKAGG
jgi:uncharacterized damage-inducible protein DinB